MQTKPLAEIIVPENRVRKKFSPVDLTLLAQNIAEKGLFHPILLQNDGKTLIAGEHRLKAITELAGEGKTFLFNGEEVPPGHIPFTILAALDPLAVREAEIEENDLRVELSWQDRAAAVADLHQLRLEQAEARGDIQHLQDTAKEIRGETYNPKAITDVRDDLITAQFLDDDDVAKAASRKEAMKIIEKKLRQEHREKLAETHQLNKTKSPHSLIHGSLFDELPKYEPGSFECIISDPPYGIGADTFKNQSAVKHTYQDDADYADQVITCIAEEGYRITTEEAHLYMFHDVRRFPEMKAILEAAGWYVWPWPMIWYKGNGNGLLPRPSHGPRRVYEAIVYAIKGDKETQAVGPDVLAISHDKSTERGAHKPVDLYETLINRSCLPGDRVLDPTCGTAPILTAATRCNVIATAIEIEAAGFGQAMERLQGLEEIDNLLGGSDA